ncbi:hypothetical protein [Streptomyces sp. NPDC047042]|uniref:hypothetical protein n=1 Tax=Streptomyces sp. NPDC047042 TaxID=3154807 RepID=UPI003401D9A4
MLTPTPWAARTDHAAAQEESLHPAPGPGPTHRPKSLKGTQIHTLAKRYNLRCRDVRFALEIPRLTTAEAGPLTDPITGELADLIESMISRRLNGRQIWTELLDHHDYLITYDSIRHYIRYARRRRRPASGDNCQ